MAVEQVKAETALRPYRKAWYHLNQRQLTAYLMVIPAIVIIVAVVFFPIGQTFWFSLHDIDRRIAGRAEPFIGLQNYFDAFTKESAQKQLFDSLIFTTAFAVISVGLEFLFGLGVALILNREFKGR